MKQHQKQKLHHQNQDLITVGSISQGFVSLTPLPGISKSSSYGTTTTKTTARTTSSSSSSTSSSPQSSTPNCIEPLDFCDSDGSNYNMNDVGVCRAQQKNQKQLQEEGQQPHSRREFTASTCSSSFSSTSLRDGSDDDNAQQYHQHQLSLSGDIDNESDRQQKEQTSSPHPLPQQPLEPLPLMKNAGGYRSQSTGSNDSSWGGRDSHASGEFSIRMSRMPSSSSTSESAATMVDILRQQQNERRWISIRDKLYGREIEKQIILDEFYRFMDGVGGTKRTNANEHNNSEHDSVGSTRSLLGLVVVTGPSGVGKSSLARIIEEKMMEDNAGTAKCGTTNLDDDATIQAGAKNEYDNGFCDDDHTDNEELKSKDLRMKHSFFLEGKCDQIKHDEPFAPFVHALTQFVNQVLEVIQNDSDNGEDLLEAVGAAIDRSTEDTGVECLVDMIPAMSRIFSYKRSIRKSNTDPVGVQGMKKSSSMESLSLKLSPSASPTEKSSGMVRAVSLNSLVALDHGSSDVVDGSKHKVRTRLNGENPGISVICRLFKELCCNPMGCIRICVFIDDLQWLDSHSIGLLRAIALIENMRNFMLVGTCRGNEVLADSDLSMTFREIEDNGGHISDIQLKNLDLVGVTELIVDLLNIDLQRDQQDIRPLASFVIELTDGNPFVVVQFLRSLLDRNYLSCSDDGIWVWNEEDIIEQGNLVSDKEMSDILVELAIRRNTETTTQILQIASCLGSEFSISHIQLIVDTSPVRLQRALDRIQSKALFKKSDGALLYRWTHDQFQKSAYSLIPVEERDAFRYHIGRTLMVKLDHTDLTENAFLISGLLMGCEHLTVDDQARDEIASLYYTSGNMAAQSTAFEEAARYFQRGIDLLADDPWERESMYELSLQLYQCHAEMECCLGHTEKVDGLVDEILKNARSLHESIRAYDTLIYSLSSRGEQNKSIDVGFTALEILGVKDIPRRTPGMLLNVKELLKTMMLLRRVSTEDVLSLPRLRKWEKSAILHIISLIFPSVLRSRPEYALYLVAKGVRITLKHGMSPIASILFSALGMMLCNPIGLVEEGLRCGDIGLAIYERYQAKDLKCRIMLIQNAYLRPWREPAKTCLSPLLAGANAGMISGDIEMAFVCKNEYSYIGILCGLPLKTHCNRMQQFVQQLSGLGQETVMFYLKGALQLASTLSGKTDNPFILSGADFDATEALEISARTNHATGISYISLLQLFLAVYMSDFSTAVKIARRLQKLQNGSLGAFETQYFHFLTALSSAVVAGQTGGRGEIRSSLKSLNKLRKLTKDSTESWMGRFEMVLAEHEAFQGNYERAARKLNFATDCAARNGFIHEKAFCLERRGLLLVYDLRRTESGLLCLREARQAYDEWGCAAKAAMIDDLIEKIK